MELHNGGKLTDRVIEPVRDRKSAMWAVFAKTLHAPNDVYLPLVRTPQATIYQLEDGKMRLYRVSETELVLETDGKEKRLDTGEAQITALAFDAGLIAALDKNGQLHYFQQAMRVGTFDTGLRLNDEFQPQILRVKDGVIVCNGEQIALFDSDGREIKRMHTGYTIGALACSPDGTYLAAGDLDSNIIRVYDGRDFTPTHQRFALDLLADAKKSQSITSAAAANTAVGALAITSRGVIAFSMSGMVCATNLTRMIAVPGGKSVSVES
jgi:WD40 repeat protein